jgi:hypothetical protein
MSDLIRPAMLPSEWEMVSGRPLLRDMMAAEALNRGQVSMVIALANAALPDSDPRKITRKHIAMLREAGRQRDSLSPPYLDITLDDAAELLAFADALESYLPPASPS